ncbi:hypothetical protein SAMN04488092_103381 [Thalassovita taeanensis]|uniref:Uncharacterized protein n=2 Tax=Thalassovita taeanensis TaxID=657014 RepID=A0A1H9CT93_9RHOB|nr:hypothetical protein SAMN04488092_103381 [Thalassovita taeanensis]
MYLRGAHGENDSSVSISPHSSDVIAFDPDQLSATLLDRFAIPLDGLISAWDRALGRA